jgi:hypothetical protein
VRLSSGGVEAIHTMVVIANAAGVRQDLHGL